MKTEYKVIVLSILLGLFIWVADAALDYFIFYQGTFWGLLIYEVPPHEIYARTLVLGCCVIFGVAISMVLGKFRRAEEKQRESEKQLRLAVKNSRDVLYKLNLRTGDFDYVSPSVVELGGYTPQEFVLLGVKGLLRRIDPEDRHRFMMHFRNVLRQAVEDGLAPTIEYRWKHHDGEYRWLSDNRAVIRDTDGNPVSLIGSVRDVTEQKVAEWALWESEKKYRTMIETAQEGIGITSLGEELVFVNRAFASILGYEPSELVGRNLREFVTEERFEAFQVETGKRQWGTSGRYETEMRHRDGSHRSLLVSASPLYDREGNYNGTLGMVTDITERKKEQEIQSALSRISQAVTSTGNLEELLQTTHEVLGELIDTTNYYVALYDAEKEEYSFPYSVDQDEETDFSTRQLKRSLTDYVRRTGKPLLVDEEANKKLTEKGEVELVGRPGPIWLGVPLKTPRGVIGVAVVQHYSDPSAYSQADLDILSFVSGHLAVAIERKRAQEELQESEERYRDLFENASDLIQSVAPDGRFVYVNRAWREALGYSKEEIAGLNMFDIIHPDSRAHCMKVFQRVISGEEIDKVEAVFVAKDGTEIMVEGTANCKFVDGKPISTRGIFRDITERRKAEEALRKAHDELEIRVEERTAELVRANEDLLAEIAERNRVEDALRLQSEIVANMAEGVQLTRASDGVIVYTNPRFEDMFGYGHGELIGKNVSVLNAPSDKSPKETAAEIIKSLSEERVWYGEIQNIKKDGTHFWCRASVSTLEHRQHGSVWVAVHEDITTRKRAEQELEKHRHHLEELVGERTADLRWMNEQLEQRITERKRAEEEVREAMEFRERLLASMHDGFSVLDKDGVHIEVNPALCEMTGFSREELIGVGPPHPYWATESLEDTKKAFEKTVRGEFQTFELTFMRKQGERFPVLVSPSWLKDEHDNVLCYFATFKDITERKRAEEKIREQTEFFKSTIEALAHPFYVIDANDYTIKMANSAAGFGTLSEKSTCYGLTHRREKPCEGEEHPCPLRIAKETRKPAIVEHTHYEEDGNARIFQVHGYPIFDGKGNVAQVIEYTLDITERKKAEEAVQKTAAEWETTFNSITDLVSVHDKDFRFIRVNKGFAGLLKMKPEELAGKKCYEVVHGRERPPADCPHKQMLESKKAVTSEFFDPQLGAYLQASASPIFDEDGEVAGSVHIVKDITERKRAEEELGSAHAELDQIFNTAADGMRLVDKDFNVLRTNTTFCSLSGVSEEEAVGKKCYEVLRSSLCHTPDCPLTRILGGEERVECEVEKERNDGLRVLCVLTATPFRKPDGELVGIVEDFKDVTERKKAEEAIRHSEEQLRALFDSAADIVFTKDRQGRYTRVNSACARLHGISEEEFLGKIDFDLFPEEQAKHSADIDRQVLVEGRTFTGEYDRQVKGKTLTFSVVKTPLYGHDGAIIGLCGIARDITEQKSIEEQFRQAQKMESLGTLAGGVAHDFNNLLGGILGYVGLIKGDYSPEDKHYAMLELVEKASVRAAELTNQLLAFSRKGKYEVRPVSLNNSVEDVLKLLGRTLDKSIEIATELQEKLPSVEGDPGQLEQAILNLCVNAAEAMPGGGKLQLETRVVALGEEFARKYLGSDPGDYVLLSVSDTGIGMDSETLSRMFEPFFTTKEVGKGTGLGLSTVYGIVKNHGGYVDVRSQPGKGSTFDIYLPVSKKQFTPPRPRAAELQTGHETILAVDDEEIIRSLLEETLEKLGYKVILANDGEEAVQIYEERKDEIDAVIIDMIMPHVGGRETFREIKRRNPDVRVLLASGYSQDGAAQRILDEGVRGFIQKPFELVELSQKLREVLD